MKKAIEYTTLAALLLLSAASCAKEETGVSGTGEYISITARMDETRAILNPGDISHSGTEMCLYGLAGDVAQIAGITASAPQSASQGGSSTWTISTALKNLEWQDDKDYKFYSWLQKDGVSGKAAATFFGTGFGYASGVVSVPRKKLDVDKTHFDFCYSDIVNRDAGKADYSPVDLKLRHLFTSFSLSAANYTSSSITIKEVELYGIHNEKSATVDFSGDEVAVTYTTPAGAATMSAVELITAPVTIDASKSAANIIQTATLGTSEAQYFLMWPQVAADLAAAGYSNSSTAPTGTGNTYMKVVYNQNGGSDMTRYILIPQDSEGDTKLGWPAGTRQNMELSFSNKSLSLTVSPSKWNQTAPSYDYEGAVNVLAGLSFNANSKHVIDGHNVYFRAGYPILLDFKIGAPLNASWMVEKVGDFDAFEIDDATPGSTGIYGDGIDSKEGVINGEVATISIYPKISDPQKDYVIHLSFTVRGNNGVVTNINNEVQGASSSDWYNFIILK